MGQMSDSGRNASLDEQKKGAAGRRGRTGQADPSRQQIKDPQNMEPAKGKTGGALGATERPTAKGVSAPGEAVAAAGNLPWPTQIISIPE